MDDIFKKLRECDFKISTDTRVDVSGSVFFALKGENFDGNTFAREAVKRGAIVAVVDDPKITGDKIYLVDDAVRALQETANFYRKSFNIPVLVIGGSNGKTTSKELVREVLKTKYRVHATEDNLNSQMGVPASIFSMNRNTEIAVFEIGANHPQEHTRLMKTIEPTAVVITNNGLDHLEGFGSPAGVRRANKEIYDWARGHSTIAFVDKDQVDLMEDSEGLERILYPNLGLEVTNSTPLIFKFGSEEYNTNLAGKYNLGNVHLALSVGEHLGVDTRSALDSISQYKPSLKRSEILRRDGVEFILDCYNANPSSMRVALESFFESAKRSRGVILGDMLELGDYAEEAHLQVIDMVSKQDLEEAIFIGENFKKALSNKSFKHRWFTDSEEAGVWFRAQSFAEYTFLLKGSKGSKVGIVLGI